MVLPGFNTDFKHKGETYHVQTEDNGAGNPVVVTLLYFKGAILASKRTSYRELLERDSWQKELMELMKSQHVSHKDNSVRDQTDSTGWRWGFHSTRNMTSPMNAMPLSPWGNLDATLDPVRDFDGYSWFY